MYATDTILTFALPAGRIGGTKLRISFLLPVLALGFIWRLQSVPMGLLATSVVFFSVLLHELTHLLAARSTGGDMDEIKMWPLGGLSEPYGRGYLQDHVHTMLAGPVANLLLAMSCLLVLTADQIIPLLNPFDVFTIAESERLDITIYRLVFLTNWVLFIVNMIPVTPLDNGVLLRTYLTTRFTESESRDLMIRFGLVAAIFGMLTGYVFDLSGLVMLSSIVLVLQIHDNIRWYEVQSESLTSHSYDFPSAEQLEEDWLERSESQFDDDAADDVLDRWRIDREEERLRLETEERQREEQQMDDILLKLHRNGRDSLTSSELLILTRVSDRIRSQRIR